MSIDLTECVSLSEGSRTAGQSRVDRAKGIIHRVKVLGWDSANGRRYLREGVKASLYEGKRVNAGHVKGLGDRDPRDTYAVLEGLSVEDTGVYADRLRLLNPAGEFEQRLMGSAENAPHLFGLSHVARGKDRPGSNGKVIESVERVDSVDLVGDPATVSGWFESRGQTMKLKDLIESLKDSRPEYARALKEMAEAGVVSPDAQMDAPSGEAGQADHELALMAGFKAAVAAIMDDKSMSWKVKVQKFRDVVKAQEKLMGSEETAAGAAGADGAESNRSKEEANLREEVERLKAEKLVRKAAGEANLTLKESLIERLARPGMTEADAKAAVADVLELKRGGAQQPRSAAPLTPKQGENGAGPLSEAKVPTDPKEFAGYVTGH